MDIIEVYLKNCTSVELRQLHEKVVEQMKIRKIYSVTRLVDTNLSVRTLNVLRANGYETLEQASNLTFIGVRRLRGAGIVAASETRDVLNEYGFELKPN